MIDEYIFLYGRRLYGLCLRLCGNAADAEDLYQDTWLRAMEQLHRYDPACPFEPWLTTICVNLYRSLLRRMRRSPVFDGFADAEEKEAVFARTAAEKRADYTDLYAAIDRLPQMLRITVILFYFRDMKVEETAAVLGVPVGTVKSRLHKARKRLKEVLQDASDLQL